MDLLLLKEEMRTLLSYESHYMLSILCNMYVPLGLLKLKKNGAAEMESTFKRITSKNSD